MSDHGKIGVEQHRAASESTASEPAQDVVEAFLVEMAPPLARLVEDHCSSAALSEPVLAWLDDLRSGRRAAALGAERLETVLRALGQVELDRCAFRAVSRPLRPRPGERLDLDLTDRGGALLARLSMGYICEMLARAHGDRGRAAIGRARDHRQDQLKEIERMIRTGR